MKTKFFHSLSCCSLLFTTGVAIAAQWDKKFYDPQEIDGSVILPMPCDGAMVFRVVKTDTRAPLEDKSVLLGSEGGEQGFFVGHLLTPIRFWVHRRRVCFRWRAL